MNVAIAYTCPHTNCTIALTGTVPGIGLNAVSGGTANNVTTSLVVSSASGTVYLNGTVQASAVPSGNSAAFTPGLSITDAGSVVRTAANGAWTMYTAPTVSTLAANSFKTTTSPNVALTYTCPSASVANPCTISLSGALNGTGLSATSANTSTTATSLSVTTTSGTFYIGGTVTAAAVPSGTFKKFTPVLTIADTPLATASTTANWTAYTASYVLPTLSIPSAKSWARANLGNSASVTYGCTNKPCTITLTGSPSVPVGLGILATNTTTDQQANNSAAVSVVVNPAGTSGTVYVEGKISAAQTTGAYVLTMTNTDTNGVIVTSSFTVTVT
jgi:hypothetical protein